MVLLGTGAAQIGPLDDLARQLCMDGPKDILGAGLKLHITPNAIEDYHDMRDVSCLISDELMLTTTC